MWFWVAAGCIVVVGFVAFIGAPYVPTRRADVVRMFDELYEIGPGDVFVDIGSGDGIILREAAKRGAMAIGYEIHPLLVLVSRFLSRHEPKVRVQLANFWYASLPDTTTVVYTFGDTRDIGRMYKKIQSEATRLGKTLHFISYAFEVPHATLTKTVGAHHLYTIKPLQESS